MMEEQDIRYFNRIEELINTHPINMDGIMQVIEQITYMSNYGVFPDQICKWLKGLHQNDFGWSGQSAITEEEIRERLILCTEVIRFAQYWHRNLVSNLARLENERLIEM
jgi:hypothetical protein